MPVAVVALAAGSMAAGVSAFAAATTVAGMVAAGASIVGGALTIIGTVTGNAKLTKIGGIVGLAGAAGSLAINLANGAAAAGSAAAADAASSAATDAAADVAGSATGAATDAAASAAGDALGSAATDAASATGSAASNVGGGLLDAAGATTTTASAAPGGLLEAAGTQPVASATADALGAGNVAGEAGKAAFDSGATAVGQANNVNAFKAASPFDALGKSASSGGGGLLDGIESYGSAINNAGPVADTSMFGKLGAIGSDMQAWAKANPMLAKAALDGTGALVKGLAPPTEQEKAMMAAYKAQTEAQQRRARWGSGRV